ncbi:hypothetical protein GCM10011409_31730 [Lentibacillus populi]|uniref:Uncharacterized protein n=1 Tax=Lentibacillus populi TaxID=1827502 RepID=A0A9W5TZ92_9BACI|nr:MULTISPECIES: hypothetical protein [Bacillaceae]GGB51814.1 hypothetical protein GCM10011409_31730 [Lentibacillus populi]
MPKAFLICNSKKFKKDNFLIPIQQELLENEGESVVSIDLNYTNFHLKFDQYICHNDYIHNTRGRVFNKDFNYYLEPLSFYSYYKEDENLLFIQTKTDAALDFISKLSRTKEYNLETVKIDFKSMIPLITEVAGAWIADLKRAHLKTAGYFGHNVHRSEEYKESAAEGNVSSIQMKYISLKSGKEHYIAISKKGSIILYDTFPTIEDEIDIVYEVYEQFIKPHL